MRTPGLDRPLAIPPPPATSAHPDAQTVRGGVDHLGPELPRRRVRGEAGHADLWPQPLPNAVPGAHAGQLSRLKGRWQPGKQVQGVELGLPGEEKRMGLGGTLFRKAWFLSYVIVRTCCVKSAGVQARTAKDPVQSTPHTRASKYTSPTPAPVNRTHL